MDVVSWCLNRMANAQTASSVTNSHGGRKATVVPPGSAVLAQTSGRLLIMLIVHWPHARRVAETAIHPTTVSPSEGK